MFISDNETAVDLLYYEAIAKTIVGLINESADEPMSIGIHGDWGAGKSSILLMTERAFGADATSTLQELLGAKGDLRTDSQSKRESRR